MMQPKQAVVDAAAKARRVSIDMNDMAEELEQIASTLPSEKDRALYKATTLSKPLRYIKSQSKKLPKLTKREKQKELQCITAESLNIGKDVAEKNPKRVQVMIILGQFLQCLLWDFDFRFTLLPHQIEAVFAVAGVKVSPLLDKMVDWDNKDLKRLIVLNRKEGVDARKEICKNHFAFSKTKGLLLADAMGLGKTVESIAAVFIRNGVVSIKSESADEINDLPTMILGPNEAVLNQWEESLIMSGIDADRVKYFDRNDKSLICKEQEFILITRYALMTEVRTVLKGDASVLFPDLPESTQSQLNIIFGSSQKGYGESKKTDVITQVLKSNMTLVKPVYFRSLIIDEAHMMKNMATYWSCGAGILSAMSERIIPVTATPYIHGPQDMATINCFIDPCMPASTKQWWKDSTQPGEDVVKIVQQWRQNYFVRREKSILEKELPVKTVSVKNISSLGSELAVYKEHEKAFFDALTAFSKLPKEQEDKRELVNFLFAQLTCMRMSLIHPLLTKGREFTVKFSPSRRDMQPQLSKGTAQMCVCCEMGTVCAADTKSPEVQKLIPVPGKLCHSAKSANPHFVHEKCLTLLQSQAHSDCPRCKEFSNLAQIDPKAAYKIPYKTYSKTVVVEGVAGFKATSKIEQVVNWVQAIPQEDKAIVYSFFEGSLDLLEGILVENLEMECARFDDDIDPEAQAKELSRFKKSPTCRLLLATVQSSGTGLNIEEANHIAFLDRCFDTSIHRQGEDRILNLRQQKEVEVTYFDASMTVDEIMSTFNKLSSTNDTVILADGTEIGAKEPTIKYADLSGPINNMMKALANERERYLSKHPENALIPSKANLTKLLTEKENVASIGSSGAQYAQQNATKPANNVGALADSSNRDRRVAYAPPITHHQGPPTTPSRPYTGTNYAMPYAAMPYTQYNYLTAMQSPISPSYNYSAYHGYGMPLAVNNSAFTPQGSIYQQVYPNGSVQVPNSTTSSQLPSNRQSFTTTTEHSYLQESARRSVPGNTK